MNMTLHFAAMYVSEIWYGGWIYVNRSQPGKLRRDANFCRAKALVMYDRIMSGRIRVEL